MFNYYITSNKTWAAHVAHMADSHFFDHNGEIVLCCRFLNGVWHDAFHAEADVTQFPHLLEGTKTVGAAIAAKLSDLLLPDKTPVGVLASDTTFQAAMKLRKHNPRFDPRVFT
jgi:hypothetical protein